MKYVVVDDRGKFMKEVEVMDSTSVRYAALHVAEALDLDVEETRPQLMSYPLLKYIDPDEVSIDWNGKRVCLWVR